SPSELADLAALLAAAAAGHVSSPDALTVVEPPDTRSVGVFAFTGYHVISAPVSAGWVRALLPVGDLSAPLNPPFLSARAKPTGLAVNNLDAVLVAAPGPGTGVDLALSRAPEHPRGTHRTGVQVWVADGGVMILGRGVAGRLE